MANIDDETIKVFEIHVDGERGYITDSIPNVMEEIESWLINIDDAADGTTTFKIKQLHMTQDVYDNLPEFQGW